jgi:hypothetical protein
LEVRSSAFLSGSAGAIPLIYFSFCEQMQKPGTYAQEEFREALPPCLCLLKGQLCPPMLAFLPEPVERDLTRKYSFDFAFAFFLNKYVVRHFACRVESGRVDSIPFARSNSISI